MGRLISSVLSQIDSLLCRMSDTCQGPARTLARAKHLTSWLCNFISLVLLCRPYSAHLDFLKRYKGRRIIQGNHNREQLKCVHCHKGFSLLASEFQFPPSKGGKKCSRATCPACLTGIRSAADSPSVTHSCVRVARECSTGAFAAGIFVPRQSDQGRPTAGVFLGKMILL